MLSAEVRELLADYKESLTKPEQSVEAGGTVYVHETLAQNYIHRVLSDVLSSLARHFGVDDVFSVTVASPGPTRPDQGNPGEDESRR